ncbi:MAG: HAMP domain-containing histidine kinase [Hymenobacter sp.]|nr:MAG: HAMP domain-containing histidine kinase [Hymenobacter sp.]
MRALRGLRGQLALAFGLATGLAGFYQYRQVGRVLHQGDDRRLRARAQALLSRVEVDGVLPVVPLPSHGEQVRVVIEVAGQPAHELFHSPSFRGPAEKQAVDTTRMVEEQRAAYDELGRPVRVRLWLAHSAAPLAADLRRVRLGLGAVLAGSLALAAGLAAGLGWWVLRPLRRIGAAPSPERLPEPATGDEVQELAQALNRMLDRLQAGAELQDNFLAAAAHELRTPLAVLQTALAVTRQAPKLPASLRAPLDAQAQELQRLGRLVEDFLLVSRLRSDALPLTRRPVALDELVLAAADQLLPRFMAAGWPLHLTIAESVADYAVAGDADKLTTVMLNLLENALRHALPGTAVRVVVGAGSYNRPFLCRGQQPTPRLARRPDPPHHRPLPSRCAERRSGSEPVAQQPHCRAARCPTGPARSRWSPVRAAAAATAGQKLSLTSRLMAAGQA